MSLTPPITRPLAEDVVLTTAVYDWVVANIDTDFVQSIFAANMGLATADINKFVAMSIALQTAQFIDNYLQNDFLDEDDEAITWTVPDDFIEGGEMTIPPTVFTAFVMIASNYYQRRVAGISSEKVGDASVSFSMDQFTQDIRDLLDPFKVITNL